jgi:Tfp pilus assembly protein PilF
MEQQEEIIIIDESDAAGLEQDDTKKRDVKIGKKRFSLTKYLIAIFLLLLIIFSYFIFTDNETQVDSDVDINFIEKKLTQTTQERKNIHSRIEGMIKKANMLYQNGQKEEALALYEKIALFNESVSYYNLGIAQLKRSQYSEALEAFKKAIENQEHTCVSAINAAVSAHHLKQPALARYYIDLAESYLYLESDSENYSYYFALIQYYKQNYLAALSALRHSKTTFFKEEQQHMRARIEALLGNNHQAINVLEASDNVQNQLPLGLLYAQTGDLKLAKQYLEGAVQDGVDYKHSKLALSYVDMKLGNMNSASSAINNLLTEYDQNLSTVFPIDVFLKASLFDVTKAQQEFASKLDLNEKLHINVLFHFAPYKIFNPIATINDIKKGSANISVNSLESATNYLKKSSKTSKINHDLTKAVKYALSDRIYDAKDSFKKIVEQSRKNGIAHYNYAITLAKLGDMSEANKHFVKSYHLDAKNYLSGLFAIMSAKLINKEQKKLYQLIRENLSHEEESEEIRLFTAMLNLYDGNLPSLMQWLESDHKDGIFYTIFDLLAAKKLKREFIAKAKLQRLNALQPDDIMTHILHVHTYFSSLPSKDFSRKALNYFKKVQLPITTIFNGSQVSRELYVHYTMLTGKLYPLKERLIDALSTTSNNTNALIQALALTNIYLQFFEEAYTLYNQLIDEKKERDAITLFLGAVASIGADHHANAIALLELAKLKDPSFMESRYALALLYFEAKNYKAGSIQLAHIGNSGFQSKYFNFNIRPKVEDH